MLARVQVWRLYQAALHEEIKGGKGRRQERQDKRDKKERRQEGRKGRKKEGSPEGVGSWALTEVKGISVRNASSSKYGKQDKGVERQVGAYFPSDSKYSRGSQFWVMA